MLTERLFVENQNHRFRRQNDQVTNCKFVGYLVEISLICCNCSGTPRVKKDSERSRPVTTGGPMELSWFTTAQIKTRSITLNSGSKKLNVTRATTLTNYS